MGALRLAVHQWAKQEGRVRLSVPLAISPRTPVCASSCGLHTIRTNNSSLKTPWSKSLQSRQPLSKCYLKSFSSSWFMRIIISCWYTPWINHLFRAAPVPFVCFSCIASRLCDSCNAKVSALSIINCSYRAVKTRLATMRD